MIPVYGQSENCCVAPHCVAKKREFVNGDPTLFIIHQSMKVHLFHPECFMVTACKDSEYLKTGIISKCFYCNHCIENYRDCPTPEIAAPIALRHHVKHRNLEEVQRLCATRFIPIRLKSWALSFFS